MMCKACTAIFEEKLGQRRVGWCVYLHSSGEFTWMSDKQIKSHIGRGDRANGLMVTESGEVGMDETFTTGLLTKAGLATFTPINEEADASIAKYFAVTRVFKAGKGGSQYELVSNRMKIETVSEERLKALLMVLSVGGVRLDEKGKVVVHEAVEVVPDGAEGVS